MSARELIDTGTDKRYVRRDEAGRFKESADVGRSLAADRRNEANGARHILRHTDEKEPRI